MQIIASFITILLACIVEQTASLRPLSLRRAARLRVAYSESDEAEVDYVVIGSGIGGLSCAALLGYYGYSVEVLESHYLPGGCAHSFVLNGFKFDAGPSLWNGMDTKPYNPLRQVLEIVGEGNSVQYAHYNGWVMHIPEGTFKFTVGENEFEKVLSRFGGPTALNEWERLNKAIEPVIDLSNAVPPLALRSDAFAIFTLFPYLLKLIRGLPVVGKVEGSFKAISQDIVKDKFLENWFEFLSFALSGLPADGTIAAAVAYTMRDLHQRRACLDYPIGGSGAIVEALVRAIVKRNGKVSLNAHVKSINIENGRASGVTMKSGKRFRAKRAVISNASVWNTMQLLPKDLIASIVSPDYIENKMNTPMTGSFVHLHLGINASGLPVIHISPILNSFQ
jgi:phytoene dehydrogenase-like protein